MSCDKQRLSARYEEALHQLARLVGKQSSTYLGTTGEEVGRIVSVAELLLSCTINNLP